MIGAHGLIGPSVAWSEWTLDVVPLTGLAAAVILYGVGVQRASRVVSPPRVASFYIGCLVLAGALFSPLDHAATEIFTAHMLQHLLLMLVAPPLLVLGRPMVTMTAALPQKARRSVLAVERTRIAAMLGRAGASAIVVLGVNVVVLWAWHLPDLYEAALDDVFVHALEHLSFLAAACMFWTLVLGKRGRRPGSIGRTLGVVFGNLLQSGALGAVLVFAGTPLYPSHGRGASLWELTALQDQQIAGALMWVPPAFLYIGTMSFLFLRWLRTMELADARRAEVVEADV